VFTPVHASWLNQIEIYFSIVQRKVLTPGDFKDLAALEATLLGFQDHYEAAAVAEGERVSRERIFRQPARGTASNAGYRPTDNENTWTSVDPGPNELTVFSFAMDASGPNTIYAGVFSTFSSARTNLLRAFLERLRV